MQISSSIEVAGQVVVIHVASYCACLLVMLVLALRMVIRSEFETNQKLPNQKLPKNKSVGKNIVSLSESWKQKTRCCCCTGSQNPKNHKNNKNIENLVLVGTLVLLLQSLNCIDDHRLLWHCVIDPGVRIFQIFVLYPFSYF